MGQRSVFATDRPSHGGEKEVWLLFRTGVDTHRTHAYIVPDVARDLVVLTLSRRAALVQLPAKKVTCSRRVPTRTRSNDSWVAVSPSRPFRARRSTDQIRDNHRI